MGKGFFKYGKSGILPKPRPLFKTPVKPSLIPNIVTNNHGYAPDIVEPKGSHRDPLPPKYVSLEKRIELTVKEPKPRISVGNEFKARRSSVRREFLKETLAKQVELDEIAEKRILSKRHKEKEDLANAIKSVRNDDISEATRLTLPTIDSFLNGRLIEPLTAEEKQLIADKKKANYLTQKLKLQKTKAENLFTLYQMSERFIVTEDHLDAAIDAAFPSPNVDPNVAVKMVADSLTTKRTVKSARDNTGLDNVHVGLLDAIRATTANGKVSLTEVDEFLSGESENWKKNVSKAEASRRNSGGSR